MFLDRKVVIERVSGETNGFGEDLETWGALKESWAKLDSRDGKESFLQALSTEITTVQPTVFTIRYYAGLNSKDRIVLDGVVYNIISVAEATKFGRKRFMDVLAQSKS